MLMEPEPDGVDANGSILVVQDRLRPLPWIPPFDGLRALSIIAVMIHHGNGQYFSRWALGNVAVSIFFSLSGFLAFYVLAKDEARFGQINYNYFILRRILRIWPAYFSVFIVVYFLASSVDQARRHEMPVLTFTSNWFLAANYPSQLSSLGPLWSIAVEEQFYVLAPFIFMALRSKCWIAASTALFILANAARLYYVLYCGPQQVGVGLYFTSIAYLDVFVAGMLGAKWIVEGKPLSEKMRWLLFTTAATIIIVMARFWGPIVWPPYALTTLIPYPMLGIAGGLLVTSVVGRPAAAFQLILSGQIITVIGRLSFALYLVHVPVIMLITSHTSLTSGSVLFNVIYVCLTLPIAYAVHVLIERPILAWKASAIPSTTPFPALVTWSLLLLGAWDYIQFVRRS